jgi:hypothetical protein
MILIFGREGFERWVKLFRPVLLLGEKIGFRAVDYIGASRAML